MDLNKMILEEFLGKFMLRDYDYKKYLTYMIPKASFQS